MTLNYRVNLGFVSYPDDGLIGFANNTIVGMNNNADFPSPTVPMSAMIPLLSTFTSAVTAAANGGTELTAIKNAARLPLVAALRSNAAYVQSVASQNLAVLLSSGFQANSTSRTRLPLNTPSILGVTNLMSTQLLLRLQGVANARAYELQIKTDGGLWLPAGTYTYTRNITIPNLIPGTTYWFQTRGIGGSTGYSAWSNPVVCMAT